MCPKYFFGLQPIINLFLVKLTFFRPASNNFSRFNANFLMIFKLQATCLFGVWSASSRKVTLRMLDICSGICSCDVLIAASQTVAYRF